MLTYGKIVLPLHAAYVNPTVKRISIINLTLPRELAQSLRGLVSSRASIVNHQGAPFVIYVALPQKSIQVSGPKTTFPGGSIPPPWLIFVYNWCTRS